jgi:ABC-2 type transport system ATP-binding protein
VPADLREKRIAEYSADMGITDALADKVASYSHGMKQKLAIVGALMHEPKLLIMDEPFVGLDPKAAYILKQFMRRFCDNGGAIFFSTHVLDVAEKLCDKIAIIRGGKLLADGDMETVKGNESLEEVFLELVDDMKVEEDHA